MADVDYLDALIDAAIIDIDDMTAAQRPDHLDAFVLKRFGDKMPPGNYRSGRFIFGFKIFCHRYLAWSALEYNISAAKLSSSARLDAATIPIRMQRYPILRA
jgi:hypothetical protein